MHSQLLSLCTKIIKIIQFEPLDSYLTAEKEHLGKLIIFLSRLKLSIPLRNNKLFASKYDENNCSNLIKTLNYIFILIFTSTRDRLSRFEFIQLVLLIIGIFTVRTQKLSQSMKIPTVGIHKRKLKDRRVSIYLSYRPAITDPITKKDHAFETLGVYRKNNMLFDRICQFHRFTLRQKYNNYSERL